MVTKTKSKKVTIKPKNLLQRNKKLITILTGIGATTGGLALMYKYNKNYRYFVHKLLANPDQYKMMDNIAKNDPKIQKYLPLLMKAAYPFTR